MRQYGTEDVWRAKLAGKLPAAAALALPLIAYAVMRSSQRDTEQQRDEARQGNDRERAIEALRNQGVGSTLRGQGPLPMYPSDASVPSYGGDGQDFFGAGKLAERLGRGFAKQAGIGASVVSGLAGAGKKLVGAVPGIGRGNWKGQALTAGLGVGAALGAVKGTKALLGSAGAPAHTMVQGHGPALPNYVNTWGSVVPNH